MDDSPRTVFRLWGAYEPTPLRTLPRLAAHCRVARVYVKDESRRPLGSFKSLGGMYAGLRALARAAEASSIAALVAEQRTNASLPRLICASDGNHGLAVAAAARLAGSSARVYLHQHVPQSRARRIAAQGAEINWVNGTYDDSVDAALAAAQRGAGLLISDTSARADDPVVADVMQGYALMADEIVEQLTAAGSEPPTHLFVQAGVGGLAAALAQGLCVTNALPVRIVAVEPEQVACVGHALRAGRIERIPGDLQTAAEMLSCGEASAPAMEILRRVGVDAMAVSEAQLMEAVQVLADGDGPATTPSGATGLAGLLTALPGSSLASVLNVNEASRILLIVSEGVVDET